MERILPLCLFVLVFLRLVLVAQPPAFVDAHVAAAACALLYFARPRKGAVFAAVALAGAALCATYPSWDPWVSLLALPILWGAIAFFLLGAGLPHHRAVWWGVVAGAVAHAVVGLYQHFIAWPALLADTTLDPSIAFWLRHGRPLGLSVSSDLMSGVLIAGVGSAAALWSASNARVRIGLGAAVALLLGTLVLARSFGSAAAIVVGVAVVVAAHANRKHLVPIVGAAAAAVAIVAVAMTMRSPDAWKHSADERIANWQVAARIVAEEPRGVGPWRFAPAYAHMRDPETNVTRYAHSAIAQWVAETGVVGGVALLAVLGWWLFAVWRARREVPAPVLFVAAALGARACIDYDAQIGQSAALIALFAGMATRASSLAPTAAEAPANVPHVRVGRAAWLSLLLVCGATAVVLGWRDAAAAGDDDSMDAYRARFVMDTEMHMARAKRFLDAMSNCADEPSCDALRTSGLQAIGYAVERAHPPSAAWLLNAQLLVALHDEEPALRAARDACDRALRIDPGSDTGHRMGIALTNALDEDTSTRRAEALRWHVTVPAAD